MPEFELVFRGQYVLQDVAHTSLADMQTFIICDDTVDVHKKGCIKNLVIEKYALSPVASK